jgi:membrane-bound lytic murein transglycosylase B
MHALATLIYAGSPSRRKYAQSQLLPAFKILAKGTRTPDNFVGSWAAAMGHTQFIPESYNNLAVDWTGDGVRDIWGSKEDALASTANYLARNGWKSDRPWGWEVTLPAKFNRALIGRQTWKTTAEWAKLGIKRADGQRFGSADASAWVMVPQGLDGPAMLVTKNFEVIMTYNISHSYAVAVGHLGDRIRGLGAFRGEWPAVNTDLSYKERLEMQKRLTALGFETGGSDGRFGARTYEAIIAFQKRTGLPLDGRPNRKLLERLRAGL